ncbi:carcinoembryonic antigen-related cell adhesion molecule 1-like [Erinaceus europaeus]|uniref:Carcinoembryonic antigen-related cell adhesion molecule 1-like n=1 Tax=Erinaceus europaeus TaxID=9365 RepID=A0ABM3X0Q8_ERIEU|nr:carcinoembryonic antigen-related cell adhesion molecule 1-like [Erinaceus europaeus]
MSSATSEITIEAVPPNPLEGMDVILLARNLTKDIIAISWTGGETLKSGFMIAGFDRSLHKDVPGDIFVSQAILQDNGSLLLKNVSRNNTGYYTLEVLRRSFQMTSVHLHLQVYFIIAHMTMPRLVTIKDMAKATNSLNSETLCTDGPYASISPAPCYYDTGDHLRLSCNGEPEKFTQASWLINGRPLQSTKELFIPQITLKNSASYVCLVYNSITHSYGYTIKTVTVLETVTQPLIQASKTTVSEKDTVIFTCLTEESGVSFWWLFNHKILQLTERMKLSSDGKALTILHVTKGDAGEYQCMVSNKASFRESTPLRLNVK